MARSVVNSVIVSSRQALMQPAARVCVRLGLSLRRWRRVRVHARGAQSVRAECAWLLTTKCCAIPGHIINAHPHSCTHHAPAGSVVCVLVLHKLGGTVHPGLSLLLQVTHVQ
jgi:hypothetical protein